MLKRKKRESSKPERNGYEIILGMYFGGMPLTVLIAVSLKPALSFSISSFG